MTTKMLLRFGVCKMLIILHLTYSPLSQKNLYDYALISNWQNNSQSFLRRFSRVIFLRFGLNKIFQFFLRSTDWFFSDSFIPLSSVQFTRSVMSNSLWPHGLQHTKLPCSSLYAPRHLQKINSDLLWLLFLCLSLKFCFLPELHLTFPMLFSFYYIHSFCEASHLWLWFPSQRKCSTLSNA